jgi:hypothetical protein
MAEQQQTSTTGLGDPERQASFSKGLTTLFDSWTTLNGDQRLKAVRTLVNDELAAVGVTHPVAVFPNVGGVGGSTYGKFLSQSWILSIAPQGLQAVSTAPGGFAELADTIYHETRHAEQFFRTAGRLGRKKGKVAPAEIAKTLNMDSKAVAMAVAANQKLGKSEADEADEWATTIVHALEVSARLTDFATAYTVAFNAANAVAGDYGTEPKDGNGKLTNLAPFRARFEQVWKDFEAARTQYVQCFKLYLFLAHERDAWALGTAMNEKFGGHPVSMQEKLQGVGLEMSKNMRNLDDLLK